MSYISNINKAWEVVPFGKLVRRSQYGLSESATADGVPYLKMSNIRDGKVFIENADRLQMDDKTFEEYALQDGDLLFNRTNSLDLVGKTGVFRGVQKVVFASYLVRFQVHERKADSNFIAAWFASSGAAHRLRCLATPGVSQSNINPTTLRLAMHVPCPPLHEQRKIAAILSTWDEALEKLDALIEAKESSKKALMQQLLTGKRRSPAFCGSWKKVALGDVAENVADQNKGRMGTSSLYGVTKAEGMMPMRDHVKGESFDRCKCVETDWFAYNPMRINIGSIARWQGTKTVMVSGDYVVFRCHPHKLLPAYLNHLRQSRMWQSFVTRGGNGSVRIRIYFSDLAEFTFPCPPIDEQREIAAILDTSDQELMILRTQRTALNQQKRGLMQRLLMGKVRVTV